MQDPRQASSTPPASDAQSPRLDSQPLSAQLELKTRALASSAEGITIAALTLPDNPLIYVNPGFERLTGYNGDEVIGRNCRFLQGPGTDPAAVEQLRTAIRDRVAVTVTLLNYRRNGTPFWNRLSITPVQDVAGDVTHFIGVQSDVTEEKRAKDELQRANDRLEAVSRVMRKDLQAAAEIQRSLLPATLPDLPCARFAFTFRPCVDVGGDCLNVLRLDERHLGFYILDVSGHGVASALLAVTLSHMLSVVPDRSFLFQPGPSAIEPHSVASPGEVLTRLNRHFSGNPGSSQYFTMVYGLLDTQTFHLRYVSAGHLCPIHCRQGMPQPIPGAGGIPVGMLPEVAYEEYSLTLQPGDRLYLCTDGLTETGNEAGEEFGLERVLQTLSRHQNLPLGEGLTLLMQSIEEWSSPEGPEDDVSILSVERPR